MNGRGAIVVSLPWYLLAAGIMIVILGFVLAGLPGSSGRGRVIDADMDDDEIADELRRARRLSVPSLIVLLGFACILVSIGWRLARRFL